MSERVRSFAIVPAAGHSRRMGRPKLRLPWQDGTLLEHVLTQWRQSRVSEVVVVLRKDDTELQTVAKAVGAHVVVAEVDPPDMKASVALGLDYVRDKFQPTDRDAWLLAPADLPGLTPAVIDQLLTLHEEQVMGNGGSDGAEAAPILVPTVTGRRAHPVLFPWKHAAAVSGLSDEEGVNALLKRNDVCELRVRDVGLLADIDTPEDYRRLTGE